MLGVALAVLAICWTGSRLFGPNAGFIAGLVLAGLFSTAFEGRIAKTDAMILGLYHSRPGSTGADLRRIAQERADCRLSAVAVLDRARVAAS